MPDFIYKTINLNEFRRKIAAITANNRWNDNAVGVMTRFANDSGMSELGTLIWLALSTTHCGRYVDEYQNIKDGSQQGYSKFFTELNDFSVQAGKSVGLSLPIPLLGEIVQGFELFNVIIGLFGSEARTKSYNISEVLIKRKDGFWSPNYPGHDLLASSTAGWACWAASRRPGCRTGSENCSREHYRYTAKTKLLIMVQDAYVEIIETYFNPENFADLVDNWEKIKEELISVIIPTGHGSGTIVHEEKGGCLGLFVGLTLVGVSVLAGIGYALSTLIV